ncbi:LysM peptidoglycan-binding domain-containing protein [Bacillus sp. ISL-4]|nr:LysM peptidoglycan-binding domain-containing protein [Bacillus sp. ISL-4]MBT2672298.1 LysM peptidoglycan-binding domain-containing protein [Streptomyces sp. ISL-14]
MIKYDAGNDYVYHIVKKGDSVSALAKAYGFYTSADSAVEWLGRFNLIKVNQRLRVK